MELLMDKEVQIYLKQTDIFKIFQREYNRSLSLPVSQEVGRLKLKNVPRNTKNKSVSLMKAACNSALHLLVIQEHGQRILPKSSLAPSKLKRTRLHPSSDKKILLSSIVSDIKRIFEEKKYNHCCINKTVIYKQVLYLYNIQLSFTQVPVCCTVVLCLILVLACKIGGNSCTLFSLALPALFFAVLNMRNGINIGRNSALRI
jgi:hypothetical protein